MRKDRLNKPVFQPGLLVTSKAGHDKHKLYVVVADAGDCVMLADGTRKTVSDPKRKNKLHVQWIALTVDQCLNGCKQPGAPDDAEIRKAIKYYATKRQNQEEE